MPNEISFKYNIKQIKISIKYVIFASNKSPKPQIYDSKLNLKAVYMMLF